jgi:hypothetical protein
MTYIPQKLRQQVAERAAYRCEYCQAQRKVVMYLEYDHIIPKSAGGKTTLENLALACRTCNGFKHERQTATDPQTGNEVPLFNPRQQSWSEHFAWSEDGVFLIGLTAIGRATIAQFKINDQYALETRRLWVAAGLHPPR